VYLGYETESVSKRKKDSDIDDDDDSTFQIMAKNSDGRKSLKLDCDQLLLAVGRIPNSDILDIEKTGVKVDEKGFIITDEYLETNVKGILHLEMRLDGINLSIMLIMNLVMLSTIYCILIGKLQSIILQCLMLSLAHLRLLE
jgi:alkyl hydroperoxide reductase subunit AhpF